MTTQNLTTETTEIDPFVDTLSELLAIDNDTKARELADILQQKLEGNPEYFWYAHQIISYLSSQILEHQGNPRKALLQMAYTVLRLSESMPEQPPEPTEQPDYLNLWEEIE